MQVGSKCDLSTRGCQQDPVRVEGSEVEKRCAQPGSVLRILTPILRAMGSPPYLSSMSVTSIGCCLSALSLNSQRSSSTAWGSSPQFVAAWVPSGREKTLDLLWWHATQFWGGVGMINKEV